MLWSFTILIFRVNWIRAIVIASFPTYSHTPLLFVILEACHYNLQLFEICHHVPLQHIYKIFMTKLPMSSSSRCKALDAAMAFGHCLIPVPDASKVKPKHSGCIRAWVQWRRTSGAGAERGLAVAAAPTKEALSPKLEWKACDYEQVRCLHHLQGPGWYCRCYFLLASCWLPPSLWCAYCLIPFCCWIGSLVACYLRSIREKRGAIKSSRVRASICVANLESLHHNLIRFDQSPLFARKWKFSMQPLLCPARPVQQFDETGCRTIPNLSETFVVGRRMGWSQTAKKPGTTGRHCSCAGWTRYTSRKSI